MGTLQRYLDVRYSSRSKHVPHASAELFERQTGQHIGVRYSRYYDPIPDVGCTNGKEVRAVNGLRNYNYCECKL